MPIILYLLLCLAAALAGRKRVLGFWGYLLLSLVATPLVGFAVVILGTRKEEDE